MTIVGIEHVQLAMPRGRENEARAFYAGLLGIPEVPKPEELAGRGGVWFEGAAVRVHLGVDAEFRPARKAHPAFLVEGLARLADRLRASGVEVVEDGAMPGFERVYVSDPFGNRLELMERRQSTGRDRGSVEMRSAVPTFPVPDVAAAARWYEEHLGFATAGAFPKQEPWVFASVQRGGAEIMLLSMPGYEKPDLRSRRPAGLWDAYIWMKGVRELYEGIRDRTIVAMTLRLQPYGDWEFEVRDPNGYFLVFGGE